jgi:hypothetical protein
MTTSSTPRRRAPILLTIVLGAGLAFAAWRIVALNLADHYADQRDAVFAERARGWIPGHPRAAETLARELFDADPAAAMRLLQAALPANPIRGMTYAMLGAASSHRGDMQQASDAIDAAAHFAPAQVNVRLIAAGHALAQNDLDALLRHWSAALARRGSLGATIYPDLLRLVVHPANRPAFAALLEDRISWWPAFASFAASKAETLAPVMAIYDLSRASTENTLTGRSLNPILARLQREKLWLDARLAWMDSLSPEQLDGMGNVFNGNFEAPISDVGFDWLRGRAGHVVIDTAPTAGAGGNLALYVLFRGPRVRFQHLQQILSLPAGDFVLRGRARSDDLATNRGLVWSVTCLGSPERQLATTEPVAGRAPWRNFQAPFSVPATDCPAQRLRLQLDARVALDLDARGQAWFDDIEIVPAGYDNDETKRVQRR